MFGRGKHEIRLLLLSKLELFSSKGAATELQFTLAPIKVSKSPVFFVIYALISIF